MVKSSTLQPPMYFYKVFLLKKLKWKMAMAICKRLFQDDFMQIEDSHSFKKDLRKKVNQSEGAISKFWIWHRIEGREKLIIIFVRVSGTKSLNRTRPGAHPWYKLLQKEILIQQKFKLEIICETYCKRGLDQRLAGKQWWRLHRSGICTAQSCNAFVIWSGF